MFWINLPVCVFGLMGCRFLRRYSSADRTVKLDLFGNLLLACAVFGLLYTLSGWTSGSGAQSITTFALSALLLIAFGFWESRCADPILEPGLFKRAGFVGPGQAVLCVGMTIAVVLIVPPFLLQRVFHLAPWMIGMICLSAPVGIALTSRLSGYATRFFGGQRLMMLGAVLMLVALLGLSLVPINTALWLFAALLLLYGIGYGIYQTPNLVILMAAVPSELQSTIGAVQRMLLNVGNAFGATMCALFFHGQSKAMDTSNYLGIPKCWLFAAITMSLTLLVMIACAALQKSRAL